MISGGECYCRTPSIGLHFCVLTSALGVFVQTKLELCSFDWCTLYAAANLNPICCDVTCAPVTVIS